MRECSTSLKSFMYNYTKKKEKKSSSDKKEGEI